MMSAAVRSVVLGAWSRGLSGAALDFDFVNGRGFNSIDRAKLTPDSILTYTAPSPKWVYNAAGLLVQSSGQLPYDYDPVTHAALGVLIEEQRTNLQVQSQTIGGTGWSLISSATANITSATAPDGTQTLTELTGAAGTDARAQSTGAIAVVAGTSYTVSVYIKQGTATHNTLAVWNGAVSTRFGSINIRWDAGVPSTDASKGSATNITYTQLSSGFWRVAFTVSSGVDTSAKILIYPDILGTSKTLYVWGAQLEAGAFATSYIPTVASQVTRLADQVSILTSAFGYNAAEGTLYTEGAITSAGTAYFAGFSDNSGSDVELMGNRKSGAGYSAVVVDGGVTQASMTGGTYVAGAEVEMAFAYKANDCAVSIDGAAVSTDASVTLPTVTGLYVGAIRSALGFANGPIKRLTYFPTRRSNADLQVLST